MKLRAMVVSVLLASCIAGAGPVAAAQKAKPDPCALVTAAELTSTFGMTFNAGTPQGSIGCQFEAEMFRGTFTVQMLTYKKKSQAKTNVKGLIKGDIQDTKRTSVKVSGLGNQAEYLAAGEIAGESRYAPDRLVVRKKTVVVDLIGGVFAAPDYLAYVANRGAMETLAGTALGRL
jgi:hypothetical protein